VALSLSGHYHRGTPLIVRGETAFSTGPSFCDFPHPIRIYEFGAAGVALEEIKLVEKPIGAGRRAVFIDRDGVLTLLPSYSTGPSEIEIIPGAGRAVQRLREAGFATAVVSSQACIGRGYATNHTVNACFDRMYRLLRDETGSDFSQPDTFVYSKGCGTRPVHPDLADTSDSKPAPALLLRAAETLGLSLEGSYMIGDRESDLQAGAAAGATSILVRTGYGKEAEAALESRGNANAFIVEDISKAVDLILGNE
jgi:D-glycero-D-manno-heptose 1,7-bisphosphate phosphatase